MSKQRKQKIVIFIGPPGSGKGSLSQLCSKRLAWIQLSTGNLCREHIANQTKTGKLIDFTIKSGKLISDSLIAQMVQEWLIKRAASASVIILDGYPRTVAQAEALKELLDSGDFPDTELKVVTMAITDAKIIERLCGRLVCQNKVCQAIYSQYQGSSLSSQNTITCDECSSILVRRADDAKETVCERLKVYHKHEQDLIAFYQKHGQPIIVINADQPLEKVYNELVELLSDNKQ